MPNATVTRSSLWSRLEPTGRATASCKRRQASSAESAANQPLVVCWINGLPTHEECLAGVTYSRIEQRRRNSRSVGCCAVGALASTCRAAGSPRGAVPIVSFDNWAAGWETPPAY